MNRKPERILALILCAAMCLTLAGCSSSLGAMLTVKKCYKAISELRSACFDLTATINATAGDEPVEIDITGECECIFDPFTVYIDARADLGKMGRLSVPMYIAMEDGQLNIYVGLNIAREPIWLAWVIKTSGEQPAEIDVPGIIALFENNTQPVSKSEEEQLGEETKVIPLTLELPGHLLTEAVSSGSVPKGGKMDNIVITALVDKQTYLPIRISADIAPLLQYIIDEADLKYFPEIRVDSVPVELNVTATDTIESITLPDSRRNAVVITPEQTQEPEQTQ